MSGNRIAEFKAALASRTMVGTWVKTPSPIVTEVLSRTALATLCLDAEHAPFDRGDLDLSILAARSRDMPVLVRTPSASAHHILNALDLGASGVIAPHVASADVAKALVAACHFGRSGRGYAGSTRAADYTGRKMADHIEASRHDTVVMAQIEDAEAIDAIEGIAAVDGIDCLFIGRADLTISLGAASPADRQVVDAALRVAEVGRAHGRAVGSFVGDLKEIPFWLERGVSFFLLESDHTFLLRGAEALLKHFETGGPSGAARPA